jgi:hypothetical protein
MTTAAMATIIVATIATTPLHADWRTVGSEPIRWKPMIVVTSAVVGGVFLAWRHLKPVARVVGPDAVDFGIVDAGLRRQLPVRLLNPGKDPIRLRVELASGAFTLSPPVPLDVAAGAQTTLEVAFSPVGVGPAAATLTVLVDEGRPLTIHLLGAGRESEQLGAVLPAEPANGGVR